MVSIPDPHGPNTVRPPYAGMFADGKFKPPATLSKPDKGLPSWGRKQGRFSAKMHASYLGMVKCIDDNVGKIIGAVRKAGLIEKTIILFTADHGDLCGEHGRQNKGVPYEGSAKVPLVIYYPQKIKAGTVIDEALGCVDFLPTILSLMGVKTAGREEGRDASALFLTGKAPADWRDVAFIRSTGGGSQGWLAAATDRYKLIYSPVDDPWLFDLEKDPDELTNFFRDPAYRETVRELSRNIVEYAKRYNDPRAEAPNIKADLDWAIGGSGEYVSPRPARQTTDRDAADRKGTRKRKRPRSKQPESAR